MAERERIDFNLSSLQGEVWADLREKASSTVLWGELFSEKERGILRESLRTEKLGLPLQAQCIINVRTLWQPKEAKMRETRLAEEAPVNLEGDSSDRRLQAFLEEEAAMKSLDAAAVLVDQVDPTKQNAAAMKRRVLHRTRKAAMLTRAGTSKAVVVLHAASGKLTSSWAWMKMAEPIYKQGLSTVFIDFPGFGSSSCREDPYCRASAWKHFDHELVKGVMDRMEVNRGYFLATGEGCSTVLHVLQKLPTYANKYHVFHDPIWSMDELFPVTWSVQMGGEGESVQDIQQSMFEQVLQKANCRIWATFSDTTGLHTEAYTALSRATERHPLLRYTITVTRVTREHICPAHAGSKVQVPILYPCKWLKKRYAEFFAETGGNMPGETLPEGCAGEASSSASASVKSSARQVSEKAPVSGGRRHLGLPPAASPGASAAGSSRSLPNLHARELRPMAHAGETGAGSARSSARNGHRLPQLAIPEGIPEGSEASAREATSHQVPTMAECVHEAASMQAPDPGIFRERRLVRSSMEAAALWNQRKTDLIRSMNCQTAEHPDITRAMERSMYSLQEDEDRRSRAKWKKRMNGLKRLGTTISGLLPGIASRGSA